jgi:hypothetical protein
MKIRKFRTGAAWAAIALACGSMASAQNPTLQDVYRQIDQSAKSFRSVTADISVDNFTAVVQEHSTQTGTTAFERVGSSIEMAMHLGASGEAPETYILYKNGEADVLQITPQQKTENIVAAGANRGTFDSMLTTGFGAGSKDLTDNWEVTLQGMDTAVCAQCVKLDLVPKQQNVKNNFSHETVWIDLTRDVALKQVLYQPDNDTRTAAYSNIQYNKPVPADTFKLNVPKGTQVTRR